MLIEFSCGNFRSFKDETLFSMLAGQDDTHEESLLTCDKYRLLRSAVIYGANGSGKSNFVKAIQFVRELVVGSMSLQPGQPLLFQPHKGMRTPQETSFRLQFYKDGQRYAYSFSYNRSMVTAECLHVFPKGRMLKVFERHEDTFMAGDKFGGKFENCRDAFKPNRLFLSCAANFSAVPEVAKAFEFFMNDLVIYQGYNHEQWMQYSLNAMNGNETLRSQVVQLLQSFGTNIQDIQNQKKARTIPQEQVPFFFDDGFKRFLREHAFDFFSTSVQYQAFSIALQEESSGIQRLLAFLCPYIDILLNNKVLICDELENSFHEAIIHRLVELFQSSTKSSAQLIFTTHNTSILDLETFRRDQIWFTEMSPESRSTDLYSLAEIKNVRKDENVAKGYISGKYGAIPMMNNRFAKSLLEIINQ